MTTVDIISIARNFVQYYYQLFQNNRSGLSSLYQDGSMLTFEGDQYQGTLSILQKLTSFPVFKVEPQVDTLDVQPSLSGAILIFITGRLIIDNEAMPQRFSQTFQLMPVSGGGSYFILNDIFRLNYG